MVSMSKALSLSQAATYYIDKEEKGGSKSSYWDKDASESIWFGKLVNELGFDTSGPIKNEDFQNMICQQNSDGYKVLKDGVTGEQRAGFDITTSATKEISILAEICGQNEFEKIHDFANQKILEYIQENLAFTRVTNPITKKREMVKVDSIIAASFKHHVNRAKDPQLHTHNVISNIVFCNGKNFSLEPTKIYENQKLLDQMYHNIVAQEIEKKLGYKVEFFQNEGGIFEAHISGLRPDLLANFSKRTEEVKAKLEELKIKYPDEDIRVLKERAVLESRDLKGKESKDEILELWDKDLEKLGITKEQIFESLVKVNENQEKIIDFHTKEQIVEKALESLNKDAFFSKQDVLKEALKLSQTYFTIDEMLQVVNDCKEIVQISQFQFATQRFIDAEDYILNLTKSSVNTKDYLLREEYAIDFLNNFKAEGTYELNQQQKNAALKILNSKDFLIGIQGDAGTAKTSSVAAAVSAALASSRSRKVEIVGLAPTNLAAKTLELAGKFSSFTIDAFLAKKEEETEKRADKTIQKVYIIDESSMVGTIKLSKLLKKIEKEDAKVVLIGDSKQLSAVEAGSMFAKMQEHSLIDFAFLDKSLRQKNIETKIVVDAFKEGKIDVAMGLLENHGSLITNENMDFNTERIVENYTDDFQNNVNSAMLVNTNAERDMLNELAHKSLQEASLISNTDHELEVLRISKNNDGVEKFIVEAYKQDMILINSRKMANFAQNSKLKILEINKQDKKILVEDQKTKQQKWLSVATNAKNWEVFEVKKQNFSIGEKIVFEKKNTKMGVQNGTVATIIKIEDNKIVCSDGKKDIEFDLEDYRHFTLGHAITAHKSQGQTLDTVHVFANANVIMNNLKSAYVFVSRAKNQIKLYTNNKVELTTLFKYANEKENVFESTIEKFKDTEKEEQEISRTAKHELAKIFVSKKNQIKIEKKLKRIKAKEANKLINQYDDAIIRAKKGFDFSTSELEKLGVNYEIFNVDSKEIKIAGFDFGKEDFNEDIKNEILMLLTVAATNDDAKEGEEKSLASKLLYFLSDNPEKNEKKEDKKPKRLSVKTLARALEFEKVEDLLSELNITFNDLDQYTETILTVDMSSFESVEVLENWRDQEAHSALNFQLKEIKRFYKYINFKEDKECKNLVLPKTYAEAREMYKNLRQQYVQKQIEIKHYRKKKEAAYSALNSILQDRVIKIEKTLENLLLDASYKTLLLCQVEACKKVILKIEKNEFISLHDLQQTNVDYSLFTNTDSKTMEIYTKEQIDPDSFNFNENNNTSKLKIVKAFKKDGFITLSNLEKLGIAKEQAMLKFGNPTKTEFKIEVSSDFRNFNQSKIYNYTKEAIEANKIEIIINEIETGKKTKIDAVVENYEHIEEEREGEFYFSEDFSGHYESENSKIQKEQISDVEFQQLTKQTRDELLLAEPASVLDSLGIVYKYNGGRYIFKMRDEERTASANMYLDKNGTWKFKDFGSSTTGTIENVVMEVTGMEYKEALEYCLANTNTRNYLQERLDQLSGQKTTMKAILSDEAKQRLEMKRQKNLELQKKVAIVSSVVSAKPITQYSLEAREYLASRGIHTVPSHFYEIVGKFVKDGREFTNRGIGVLTGDQSSINLNSLENVGADIHFFKTVTRRDGSKMKTQSFGVKDITFIKNESKKVAIFESKMDYAAASEQKILDGHNIIIANGVGNYRKIIETVQKHGFNEMFFFNQNDVPGEKFVKDILDNVRVSVVKTISYKETEIKYDINDLTSNGVNLQDRVVSKQNLQENKIRVSLSKDIAIDISVDSILDMQQLFEKSKQHDKNIEKVIEVISQKIDNKQKEAFLSTFELVCKACEHNVAITHQDDRASLSFKVSQQSALALKNSSQGLSQ